MNRLTARRLLVPAAMLTGVCLASRPASISAAEEDGAAPVVAYADSNTIAGVTDVADANKLERTSNFLAKAFNTTAGPITNRLLRLRALPGNSAYVHLQHLGGPSTLVITPAAGSKASLLVNGEMALDMPKSGPDRMVAVFWVERGREREYSLRLPASVTHLTVVVNGRQVAAAQPVGSRSRRLSLPAR